MNWRNIMLSGVLAAGLSLSFVPKAAADCDRQADYRSGRYAQSGGGQCSEILQRIDLDRSKIDEIGPTGRHRKALQWYQDDLGNAERDLDNCRYGRADTSYRTDRSYDPYDRSGSYDDRDPYYGDAESDQPFDFKRDWPLLLGTVINGNVGF